MTHPGDDQLILYVGGELSDEARAGIARHLEGCEPCARSAADLAAMDQVLRGLPADPLPMGFAARVGARVRLGPGRSAWWRQAAAACVVAIIGAAGGFALARATSPAPASAIVRQAAGPKFALVFAEDPATWQNVSPAEGERRYNEFMAWLNGVSAVSERLGGAQLDATRGRIVGASATAVDPRLALTGFVVIRANTYEEAAAHAARCPLIARGGQVIVRQLRERATQER